MNSVMSFKLTVLVAILDEYSKFLDTELHGGGVAGHPAADADQHGNHRIDALVQ